MSAVTAEADGTTGLPRSSSRSPGAAEDGRRPDLAEKGSRRTVAGRGKSKPQFEVSEIEDMQRQVDDRLAQFALQKRAESLGEEAHGVTRIQEAWAQQIEGWKEVKREVREQDLERRRAAGEVNFCGKGKSEQQQEGSGQGGGALNAAWASDVGGWREIKVVMDSGAAECVAPRSMAPQFAIVDSPASGAGVYYTSANGGRLDNLGQQDLPIAFDTGVRAMTTWQIADVARPLMSVGKITELGNRVLSGSAGGVLLNLASGQVTPFSMEDGVYVFTMWIPPLSETPLGGQR